MDMKSDNFDDETALQIWELASRLVYALIALPVFKIWCFTARSAPTTATITIALSAHAGVASHLIYFKAISKIGATMYKALNISYTAWEVIPRIGLGNIPGSLEIDCCVPFPRAPFLPPVIGKSCSVRGQLTRFSTSKILIIWGVLRISTHPIFIKSIAKSKQLKASARCSVLILTLSAMHTANSKASDTELYCNEYKKRLILAAHKINLARVNKHPTRQKNPLAQSWVPNLAHAIVQKIGANAHQVHNRQSLTRQHQ